MNKNLVLVTIKKEIQRKHDFLRSYGKDAHTIAQTLELCDAYWELRGYRGCVFNVLGVGDGAEDVQCIEQEWRAEQEGQQ